MRKILWLVLLAAIPLHAQQPQYIKPTKEERSKVEQHQAIIAKVNQQTAELRTKQQRDYDQALFIEAWVNARHPGYHYDISLDLFVQDAPPAKPADTKPAEPEKK